MENDGQLGKLSVAQIQGIRRRLELLGLRAYFLANTIGREMTYEDTDRLFAATTVLYRRLETWVNDDCTTLMDNTQREDDMPF